MTDSLLIPALSFTRPDGLGWFIAWGTIAGCVWVLISLWRWYLGSKPEGPGVMINLVGVTTIALMVMGISLYALST